MITGLFRHRLLASSCSAIQQFDRKISRTICISLRDLFKYAGMTRRKEKSQAASNQQILDQKVNLEKKHQPIKDYFYKGKLAGQIIQWEEANLIFNLAWEFCSVHDTPCLTVHDELIAEKKHIPMIREFMYSSGYSEICSKYSLMNRIKGM